MAYRIPIVSKQVLAHEASNLGRCATCLIRHSGLCSALSDDELFRFSKVAHLQSFRPGERILSSDDSGDFFGAISSGVVKVTKILIDGRQQIVSLLFPPDFLGQAFGKSNAYFAEAATQVELCRFERVGFQRMVDEYAGLNKHLLEQSIADLHTAHDWMILLGRKTAAEKVASLLLMLATRSMPAAVEDSGSRRSADIELHLKRGEIADFLGLTHETVSRQMAALKNTGIVKFNGTRRFVVLDLEALAAAAG